MRWKSNFWTFKEVFQTINILENEIANQSHEAEIQEIKNNLLDAESLIIAQKSKIQGLMDSKMFILTFSL